MALRPGGFKSGDGWQESLFGALGRFLLTFLAIFLLLVLSTFPFSIGHVGEIRPSFLLLNTQSSPLGCSWLSEVSSAGFIFVLPMLLVGGSV